MYEIYAHRDSAKAVHQESFSANLSLLAKPLAGIVILTILLATITDALAQRQMESLNRGVVAVRITPTQVYVSWRMLATDPADIAFNVYRDNVQINAAPLTQTTDFVDNAASGAEYGVKAVIGGVEDPGMSQAIFLQQPYLSIPLQIPPPGVTPAGEAYTYSANDISIGDLDGDGEYDLVLKWEPSNSKDNSQSGYTGNVYIDAYKLNGTKLWRINLGRNIRAGAHYTQVMVYDLDGDGRAEVSCRTSDGTVDGTGAVIGNPLADHRNASGFIITGPEYLTIFNGLTGKAMASANHIPARGDVCSWGNDSAGRPECIGNRADRFISAIAYVDGQRPSLIIGRGYYDKLQRAAWDWRDGQLTLRWFFDSKAPGNNAWSGQGNHQMTIADVDGDGRDEIFNGSSAIDDNGTGLWANGLGHGDALHLGDLDPDRPGLEIFQPYETPAGNGNVGSAMLDARTGTVIWKRTVASGDIGRGMSADIDPNFPGNENWAAGATGGVFDSKGNQIATGRPSINFGIWWDADLSRELLDQTRIDKWNPVTRTASAIFNATGTASNNGTKANPGISGDLLGDWREEVIFRSTDNTELRLYTTVIPATSRFYTLMQDPQYRMAMAWQHSAYNQPPHPGFFLGTGMNPPPTPSIELVHADGIGDGHYNISSLAVGLCVLAGDTIRTGDCDTTANQVWRIARQGDLYEIYSAGAKRFIGYSIPAVGEPAQLTDESGKKSFLLSQTGNGTFQIVSSDDTTLVLNVDADGRLYLASKNAAASQVFTFASLVNTTDCNGDWNGSAFTDDCSICAGGNTGRTACDLSLATGVYFMKSAQGGFCIQAGDTVAQQLCDGTDAQVWHVTKAGIGYELFSREAQKYLGYSSIEPGAPLVLTTARTQFILLKGDPGSFLLSPADNLGVVITVQGDSVSAGQTLALDSISGLPGQNFSFERVTTDIDCNGVWKGGAFIDNCGVCAAGNTSRQPCVTTLVSGRYRIRPVHSQLCLTPGTTVTQQVCNGTNTQEWRFNKVGSYYEISSVSTGLFLSYAQPTSGGALTFTAASGRKLFRIEVAPTTGSYFIYPSDNINIRFDVSGRSVNPGATVVMFNNGTNTNQRFFLEFLPEHADVTISNLAHVYSAQPATAAVTTTPPGLLVNITYNGQQQAPVDAGAYVVTAIIQDSVYAGSAQDTLVIEKAMLTATADNQSRMFAEENPALTISYAGFLGGEGISVLDSLPVATTEAVLESPNGMYPIIVSGGIDNNYAFNYEHGLLTVTGQPMLKVQYRVRHGNRVNDNHVKPHFQIVNQGSEAVKYSDLTLRYWYTKEGAASQIFSCDYAALGTSKIEGKFMVLDSASAMANSYLEVTFNSTASLGSSRNSGEIQTRFNKADWSDYAEANDYSYDGTKTSYADWSKVTLYYKGVLVWGIEPLGGAAGGSEEVVEEPAAFPNPFQSTFTIRAEGPFVYTIFDRYGRLKGAGHGENETTAGARLDPGMYYLQVLHSRGLFTQRMIKE